MGPGRNRLGGRSREQLLRLTEGYLTIDEVATLFGIKLPTARKYADLGIIWHDEKNGNQNLYSVQLVRHCHRLWKRQRIHMTLREIGRNMGNWVDDDPDPRK